MLTKRLLQQFVVTLVAVGVALLAYDYFRQPEIEATRKQTAELADQAQALGKQATALKNQVAEERREEAERKEKFQTASYRAEGLQLGSMAKTSIAEHYLSTGELPASNAEAGLAAAAEYRGQSLRGVTISEGGVISLTYDAKSGVDGGVIQLVPNVSGPTGLQWDCVSPDFRDIAETIPQCSYQAPDGIDEETS